MVQRGAAREVVQHFQLAQPNRTGDLRESGSGAVLDCLLRLQWPPARRGIQSKSTFVRNYSLYPGGMDTRTRHAAIVAQLHERGRVEVAELAEQLATSEVTVRRDLDVLSQAGVLRRVRGGAISLLMRGDELPIAMRELESAEAKGRIGAAAAALLRDGEAVALDSGTSGLAVAHALVGRRLTVMPLSLGTAGVLAASASTTLLLPGGTVRYGEGTLVGPATEASLTSLRFDTAVLTCCGLSASAGVTAHDVQDAAVKKAALGAAARVVLVAEAAKFSRTALAVVCALERLDVVVTDGDAPQDALAQLRAAGVAVVLA